MSALHDGALGLARAGWRIVPLPPRMKAPGPKDWPTLATNDPAIISKWWTEQPEANIAIVGGSGLLVLDVDPRHSGDVSLTALQQQYGALPVTLTARTPSGGWHFYFSAPDVGNSTGKIGAGLDIKSRGGYVVAAPSVTIEVPGKQQVGRYEWINPSIPPAQAPQWLIDLARAPKAVAATAPTASAFKLRRIEGEPLADLMSALDHLALVPDIANNALWSEVGYALLSLEDQGREIWCEWSARAPGYTVGAPEHWWAAHRSERARSDYRHVFTIAQRYGWMNPRSRAAQLIARSLNVPSGTAVSSPPHVMTLNRKNQHEATIENLVYVLSTQQQATLGYDQFRGRIMIAPAGSEDWRPLSDTYMIQLRETLAREQRFAPISKDLMHDALQLVAERHAFDSAITWLNGLIWDGVPRVEQFLVTYCGAPDDDYSRAVSLYIWSGLAARVLDPGCQLDMVVALQSPQGKHKSTGLQAMVPTSEWFTDGLLLHEDDDDFKRLIRGKVVVEIAEMAGLSKADITHLKRSITRRKEEWIEKWKTQPTSYPRRCMLFATTNEDRFLPPDETGQRRWLPVEVAGLDRDRIAADRLQLWAEGAAVWRARGVLWKAAEKLAAGRHHKYESTDVWETDIERWLNTPTSLMPGQAPLPPPCTRPLALSEVMMGALRLDASRQDVKAEKRVSRVMRQLGYESRDMKVDGKARKRWVRVA
jgi:hypothetical protein